MPVEPISGVMLPVRVQPIKRVARRAKSQAAETVADPAPAVRLKRSNNPPGVGDNLDVTV